MLVDTNLKVLSTKMALETVLKNLIDNAVKYSKDGKPILVEAKRVDHEHVEIRVTDEGIGIDPIHQKRIFDRFYRSPSEAVRNRSGTGIGLYVAAQIVRNLGSTLKVSSKGIDQGSSFWFHLPICLGNQP